MTPVSRLETSTAAAPAVDVNLAPANEAANTLSTDPPASPAPRAVLPSMAHPETRHLGNPVAYQALRTSLDGTASVARGLWSPVRCEEYAASDRDLGVELRRRPSVP